MKDCEYSSVICSYCSHTDYGCASVNTGEHNLCYGEGCDEAYARWQDENPDDSNLDELF